METKTLDGIARAPSAKPEFSETTLPQAAKMAESLAALAVRHAGDFSIFDPTKEAYIALMKLIETHATKQAAALLYSPEVRFSPAAQEKIPF